MEDGVMEDGEEKLLGGYNWKENTTRTKGLFCHHFLYGYEKETNYQKSFNERTFYLSLFNHHKYYE
jgi:hypothetical protein